MYTSLTTWYPTIGKEGEMLAGGAEVIKARQARGEQYALLTRLYSPIGSAVIVARRFTDFAAVEAARATNQADADFQAAVAAANAQSRLPSTQQLREVIVPVNATGTVKFVQTTRVYPALGNIASVRALLSEWVTSEQAKRGIGLGVDLYDPDGVAFAVTGVYPSLSAVEEHRRANQADKAFQEAAAEVSKHCRRLASASLSAVIVGFPQ